MGAWDEPEQQTWKDKLSLVSLDVMLNHTTFPGQMAQRTAAMTAFVKAGSSLRLRRALLRKHSKLSVEHALGQRSDYWREAGA